MNKMLSERLGDIFISTGANLKAGTSEITEDEALDIINLLAHVAISREDALKVLNVNNTKFYELMGNHSIPKGRKRRGFKEVVWYRDELEQSIANMKK